MHYVSPFLHAQILPSAAILPVRSPIPKRGSPFSSPSSNLDSKVLSNLATSPIPVPKHTAYSLLLNLRIIDLQLLILCASILLTATCSCVGHFGGYVRIEEQQTATRRNEDNGLGDHLFREEG